MAFESNALFEGYPLIYRGVMMNWTFLKTA